MTDETEYRTLDRIEKLENKVQELAEKFEALNKVFSHFGPTLVDLRIKGVVKPIVIFAHEPPEQKLESSFSIVE